MPPESQDEGGGGPRLSRRSTAIRAGSSLLLSLVLALAWESQGQGQIQVFFNQIFVAYNNSDSNCNSDKTTTDSVSYAHGSITDPSMIQFSTRTSPAVSYP